MNDEQIELAAYKFCELMGKDTPINLPYAEKLIRNFKDGEVFNAAMACFIVMTEANQ